MLDVVPSSPSMMLRHLQKHAASASEGDVEAMAAAPARMGDHGAAVTSGPASAPEGGFVPGSVVMGRLDRMEQMMQLLLMKMDEKEPRGSSSGTSSTARARHGEAAARANDGYLGNPLAA